MNVRSRLMSDKTLEAVGFSSFPLDLSHLVMLAAKVYFSIFFALARKLDSGCTYLVCGGMSTTF